MAINNVEPNSYVRISDNTKVGFVKIENTLYNDMNSMMKNENVKGSTTVLYNDFSSEVDAYYFSSTSTFKNNLCSIYRKTPSQYYFDYVWTLSESINFIDYNIHNNDNYEYMAVVSTPKSDGSYSYRVYENKNEYDKKIYSTTNWSDWSICNIEETSEDGIYTKTGSTWLLGLNLTGEDLTQNLSITSWDTLGKYPKLSIGERNYNSSSVTCLLGRMEEVGNGTNDKHFRYTERTNLQTNYSDTNDTNVKKKEFKDSAYSREMEKLIEWKSFCSDGALKLLKDIKGNAWIVQISDSTSSSLNTTVVNTPVTITFNWVEVMGLDDISIVV